MTSFEKLTYFYRDILSLDKIRLEDDYFGLVETLLCALHNTLATHGIKISEFYRAGEYVRIRLDTRGDYKNLPIADRNFIERIIQTFERDSRHLAN